MSAVNAVRVQNKNDSDAEADLAERAVRYNVQRYMSLLGMSQNDLTSVLHVTKGAVSQFLSGASKMKFRQVYLLSKSLGVSIEDLMDPIYMLQDEELTRRMLENRKIQDEALSRRMLSDDSTEHKSVMPEMNELALAPRNAKPRYFVMPETNKLALVPREC